MGEGDTQGESRESDATFHHVVFGEGSDDEQRYSFVEFRGLSLRKRVRLLMSMPSKFLSESGVEISRDAAMRFRTGAKGSGATSPDPDTTSAAAPTPGKTAGKTAGKTTGKTSAEEDRSDRLIRLLRESTLDHELRGCVKLAETVELTDAEQRTALASGLLRTAKLLEEEQGSTPTTWAAIRRFASLVPTSRLTELAHFLDTGNEAETMQAALQGIWHALSVDEDFGLGVLAVRVRQLLNKYLDPDWLCTGVARGLTTDLLLAYSVLAPGADESGLRAAYKRAHGLGHAIPLELARTEIREALTYAKTKNKAIAARLVLLTELAG